MASATFATVSAKKAPKAEKNVETATAVELKSSSDSLSYAAGYSNTQGLIPYLQQQFKVDTTYMADFIQGLKDAKEKGNDPRYAAYQAGGQISNLIRERMLPGMGEELKGTPDSLVADIFYAGFIAALKNDTTSFKMSQATDFFQKHMEAAKEMKDAQAVAAGKAWLEENAKKEGVQTTASGLQYKVVTMGNGEKPTATDEVEVKYEGKLIDGTIFDSSYKRNPQTTKFKANQVIKGWTEGLQLMPVGSKFEFYIPQELGYGGRPSGQIPAFSTLIFTVELISITGK
ncbi:MAG: FKBP-type peptidyl-prolyl cis-trans isomerase [Prevotella sp.]|nr:FKBP-type peptidyl-prolyl cis-trans isomerase [Candidatus Prevotella equi]